MSQEALEKYSTEIKRLVAEHPVKPYICCEWCQETTTCLHNHACCCISCLYYYECHPDWNEGPIKLMIPIETGETTEVSKMAPFQMTGSGHAAHYTKDQACQDKRYSTEVWCDTCRFEFCGYDPARKAELKNGDQNPECTPCDYCVTHDDGSTEPDKYASKTLVITSCCQEKLDVRAPAEELYTGQVFRKVREFAKLNHFNWVIISAKYGLVDPGEELDPYDQQLKTKADGERIRPLTWPKLMKVCPHFARVIVILGKKYLQAISGAIQVIEQVQDLNGKPKIRFEYIRDSRGIGGLQQHLNQLIEESKMSESKPEIVEHELPDLGELSDEQLDELCTVWHVIPRRKNPKREAMVTALQDATTMAGAPNAKFCARCTYVICGKYFQGHGEYFHEECFNDPPAGNGNGNETNEDHVLPICPTCGWPITEHDYGSGFTRCTCTNYALWKGEKIPLVREELDQRAWVDLKDLASFLHVAPQHEGATSVELVGAILGPRQLDEGDGLHPGAKPECAWCHLPIYIGQQTVGTEKSGEYLWFHGEHYVDPCPPHACNVNPGIGECRSPECTPACVTAQKTLMSPAGEAPYPESQAAKSPAMPMPSGNTMALTPDSLKKDLLAEAERLKVKAYKSWPNQKIFDAITAQASVNQENESKIDSIEAPLEGDSSEDAGKEISATKACQFDSTKQCVSLECVPVCVNHPKAEASDATPSFPAYCVFEKKETAGPCLRPAAGMGCEGCEKQRFVEWTGRPGYAMRFNLTDYDLFLESAGDLWKLCQVYQIPTPPLPNWEDDKDNDMQLLHAYKHALVDIIFASGLGLPGHRDLPAVNLTVPKIVQAGIQAVLCKDDYQDEFKQQFSFILEVAGRPFQVKLFVHKSGEIQWADPEWQAHLAKDMFDRIAKPTFDALKQKRRDDLVNAPDRLVVFRDDREAYYKQLAKQLCLLMCKAKINSDDFGVDIDEAEAGPLVDELEQEGVL